MITMKSLLSLLFLAAFSTLAGCNRDGSNGNASGLDPKAFGTWKTVGESSYMRIEEDGTFAYLNAPDSEPTRQGTWEPAGDHVIEVRFDWLEDAKRLTDQAEEIRAFVEREPEARFGGERLGITIGEGDQLLVSYPSGGIQACERVD